MKLLSLSLSILLFALPTFAAPLPEWWDAIHWGMSEDQIYGLPLGIEETTEPETVHVGGRDYDCRLSLPSVVIGEVSSTVQFLTGTTRTLVGIQFSSGKSTPEKANAAFEEIKAALVQKYGKPATEGPSTADGRKLDPTSKQVEWEDAHSRIKLEYIAIAGAPNTPRLVLWHIQPEHTQSAVGDGNR